MGHVVCQRGLVAKTDEHRAHVGRSAQRIAHGVAPVIQRRGQHARGNKCKPGLLNVDGMNGRAQRHPRRPPYYVGMRLFNHQVVAVVRCHFLQ